MTGPVDAVVIGAGHNGLVAAGYLAQAGRTVLVLERASRPGGTVATDEFAPGFRAPACFPTAEMFHPHIVRELGLAAHGLRLLRADSGSVVLRESGRHLHFDRDGHADGSTGIAAADRAALQEFDGFLERVGRAIEPTLIAPLPPLEPIGIGNVLDLLGMGWRFRGLGHAEAREALRFLPMTIQDVLDDRFASDGLKAAIAARALTAGWMGPRSPGSAFGLLHHRPAWGPSLLAAPVFVAGGPGQLASALARAAETSGVVIRTDAPVTRVLVGDGCARGVVLEGGDTIRAHAVVSSADPRRSMLGLLGAEWLEPGIVARVRNLRGRGTAAVVRFALDGVPQFPGAPGPDGLAGEIHVGADLESLERAFDGAKYGRIPEQLVLRCFFPSVTDPSLAPEGKHVMFVWIQWVPFHLAHGSWEEHRNVLADAVVATVERYAPGFASVVRERSVLTPRDFAERFALTDGCVYHADLALDQLLYMRPLPGWYAYRTPVPGFYLCGSGTHPGGGVSGLPGRNAARQILTDWKALAGGK